MVHNNVHTVFVYCLLSSYFGEFMDEGGETGFVNMLSIDSFKEKMKKEIAAWRILDEQSRLINQNKKLLGKGRDQNIMHLIGNNRRLMLEAAGKLE